MVKHHVIGIDIGTSSSRVGIWQKNHVEIIPNDLGKRKTSSYVSFTNSECLVGDRAFYQVGRNYKNTVFDFKRLIGNDFKYININYNKEYWPFEIIKKDEKVIISIESKNEAKNITPIELYSMMLVNMKETAKNYLGQEISDAVITVPAYFNNTQRKAIMEAATDIAGLKVKQIINEPTAAALAYGFNKNINNEENVLIVDLGGGTFDVTLFTINNHTYKVKATGGDTHLGGEDFTNRLIDHFVKEFKEKYKIDPSTNPKSLRRLRIECEKIKISLTSFANAQIDIDYFYDDIDFSSSITRSRFEEISSDLFEKIEKTIKMVIDDSGLDKSEINEIVLVGGSTRIPKFRNIISAFFDNKEINKTINVDEAVTCGAAIQAFILSGEKEIPKQIKDITISDVISHSISICCINDEKKIIERNSSIPIPEKNIEWTVPINQDSISFKIYEGENQLLKINYLLDEFKINQISSLSSTIKINISFNIDINGILNFSVDIYYRHKKIKSINNINEMLNSNEIEHIKENYKKYIEDEKKEKERIRYMNDLERSAFDLKEYIEDYKNVRAIPSAVIEYVKNCINDTFEWIKTNRNACKENYKIKKNKLNNCWKDIKEWSSIYENYNANMDDNDLKFKKMLFNKCINPKEISINNESKKKRIKSMNILVKQVYRFKGHIEDEKIIYRIPQDEIENINVRINGMISWIKKNNQNARKEDYETVKNELEKINKCLIDSYYRNYIYFEEDERSKCMENLINCSIYFKTYIENKIENDDLKNVKDSIINRNNNQNIYNEDYKKKKIELRNFYDNLEISFNHYENEEKERINCMNDLLKNANDFNAYIKSENNIYKFSQNIIKNINDGIADTIERINNSQNSNKEDYKKKEKKLKDIFNNLKIFYNSYENKEKEGKDCMNNLVYYTNYFTNTIKWIKYNQNAKKEDYEKSNNELRNFYDNLKISFYNYVNEEKERINCMNNLLNCAIDFKTYIENKKNIYVIPPDGIKNVRDSIIKRNELIKNNQNIYNEDCEKKKIELREIHDLKISCKHYENKEKEKIDCMKNLIKYANDFTDTIERIKNNQNENELGKTFNDLQQLYGNYEKKEKKKIEYMNVTEYEI